MSGEIQIPPGLAIQPRQLKVVDYVIVRGESWDDVEKVVKNNLKQGWGLVGQPFVDTVNLKLNYCQCMVKLGLS